MKLNIPQKWYLTTIEKEDDSEIGAGNPNFMKEIKNKEHFKYVSVEEEIGSHDDSEWHILKMNDAGPWMPLAIFYDLDLALQSAHFLDEVFRLNDE
jgi:hypothetical protein